MKKELKGKLIWANYEWNINDGTENMKSINGFLEEYENKSIIILVVIKR